MGSLNEVRDAEQALPNPEPLSHVHRAPGNSNYRWVVIALSFIIIVINYMDRSAISYAIGPLKEEFHLTNMDFGTISAAFGIGYTIMTLGGGIIVDLWGARKVWAGSAIAWSICTALLATCSGFGSLFFLRVMLGITEGPCFPAMTRAVTDWLPMSERARSTAISLAAVPIASAIGAPLISNLIHYLGWKTMFVVLGSLGIVWSVFWWFLFRDYPQNSKHVSQSELDLIHEGRPPSKHGSDDELRKHHLAAGTTTWKFILFNPSLMANNFAFFSFGYLLFFAVSWLPGFFEQTYHLKIKEVGVYLVAPWLTAAVMLLAAGFICDYLWKKTGSIRKSRTHLIWVTQMLSAICFIPVTMTSDINTVIVLVSLGIGFGLMPNAAFYALNSDLAKDRAGTSLGLMDCFLAAAGVLAPYLTGWLSTATGNFNSAILLMAALIFSSSIGVLLFQHPDRDMAKAQV
ncbi:MAG: MFS transporter [Candidatus Obscuribacterales bacterium]|nr:MFS transporter [Candidatus Obscuribacterales bacterium]